MAQDGIGHEQAVLRLHPMQRRRAGYSGRTDFRVGWLWLVRQAGLAQAIEQVLGIRGALEGEEPRAFVYRPLGIGSQDLRGLSAGLVEPSELGIGSCQAEVAEAHVRRARSTFPRWRQRL